MKLKTIFATIIAMFVSIMAFAQSVEPVAWSSSVEKVADDMYRITYKASIEQGWHIYDMGPYELGGPMATAFTFEPTSGYELEGDVEVQGQLVRHYDDVYEMEIGYYEGEVSFSQVVKSLGASVVATVDYMACNDSNCVTGDFEFKNQVGEPESVVSAASAWFHHQGRDDFPLPASQD